MAAKASYHHGNLKAALVSAAMRELAKEGIAGVSLRGVARRAGVTPPAVYRHFADKDALLAAVAAECSERLANVMIAAAAEQSDHPLEAFRAIGIALVRFAVENPEHFRALSVPGLAERATPQQRERERQWNDEQMAGLAAAQRAGMIADVPLDALMLTANSAMMGLAHQIIDGQLGDVDVERASELAVQVTHVLGHGLVPRSESPDDPRMVALGHSAMARR